MPGQELAAQQAVLDTDDRDPWARQKGESRQSFAGFCVYRDMPGATRNLRAVARMVGKSYTVVSLASAKWRWVARADAWDEERDRVSREAQLASIARITSEDVELGDEMRKALMKTLPRVVGVLASQPHAWQEWAKTLVKMRRDALGIAEPKADNKVTVAGDPDHPVTHDVAGMIAHLPPALVLTAQELAIEVAKAQGHQDSVAEAVAELRAPVLVDDDVSE